MLDPASGAKGSSRGASWLFSLTLTPFCSSVKSIQLARAILSHLISRLLTYSLTTTSTAMGAVKWKPTSQEDLAKCESKLLSCMYPPAAPVWLPSLSALKPRSFVCFSLFPVLSVGNLRLTS